MEILQNLPTQVEALDFATEPNAAVPTHRNLTNSVCTDSAW